MKAVVLYEKGKVKYEEVEVPQITDNDILVEVKACGICGSDLHFYYGTLEPLGDKPSIMGHEFSGVIVKKVKMCLIIIKWVIG